MTALKECSRSNNSDAAAPLPDESPPVRPSSGSHSPAAIAPMVVAWTAPLAIAFLPIAAVLPQLPHSGPPTTGRAAALLACAVWPALQLGLLQQKLGETLAAAIYHMMVPVLACVFAWAVARTFALTASAGRSMQHQQPLLQQQLQPPQEQAPDARPGLESGTASAAAELLAPAQQTEARPQQVVPSATASLLAAAAAAAVHAATLHTAAAAAMARAGARASALYRSRSRQVTAAFKVGGPTYVGQALVGGCSKHTHMRGRAATTSPYVG